MVQNNIFTRYYIVIEKMIVVVVMLCVSVTFERVSDLNLRVCLFQSFHHFIMNTLMNYLHRDRQRERERERDHDKNRVSGHS